MELSRSWILIDRSCIRTGHGRFAHVRYIRGAFCLCFFALGCQGLFLLLVFYNIFANNILQWIFCLDCSIPAQLSIQHQAPPVPCIDCVSGSGFESSCFQARLGHHAFEPGQGDRTLNCGGYSFHARAFLSHHIACITSSATQTSMPFFSLFTVHSPYLPSPNRTSPPKSPRTPTTIMRLIVRIPSPSQITRTPIIPRHPTPRTRRPSPTPKPSLQPLLRSPTARTTRRRTRIIPHPASSHAARSRVHTLITPLPLTGQRSRRRTRNTQHARPRFRPRASWAADSSAST